jgi:hypothetical protein
MADEKDAAAQVADAPVDSDVDNLLHEIREVRGFMGDRVKEGVAPLKEEVQRITDIVGDLERQMKDSKRDKALKLDYRNGIRVPEGRFAGAGVPELNAFLAGKGMFHSGDTVLADDHPWFIEAQAAKKALLDSFGFEQIDQWEENAIRMRAEAKGLPMGHPAVQRYAVGARSWANAMRTEVAKKKAMDSTTAGSGDELVPTFEAASLWMDVNLTSVVLPVMTQVPMPTQPYDWPTQLGNTNWYPISQNVAATTTDVSTAKVTLNAKGLKTGVPFSDELSEDSIVAFASELRSSLARNAAEVIDDVLLNADQTASNGINSDGATILATDPGKAQWLLGFDGLRHAFLVDNTGQGTNHNAAVSAAAYNLVLAKMGKYAIRPSETVFVTDAQTRIASLAIAEVETADSSRTSTLSSGELMSLYATPILVSEQMRLTDDDGKVTDPVTAAGNTEGTILGFNTTQWYVGFRRGITFETEREAGKGQTTMYVSFRIALVDRSGDITGATHTAGAYNISKLAGA